MKVVDEFVLWALFAGLLLWLARFNLWFLYIERVLS